MKMITGFWVSDAVDEIIWVKLIYKRHSHLYYQNSLLYKNFVTYNFLIIKLILRFSYRISEVS
jgi:hypothetical protein